MDKMKLPSKKTVLSKEFPIAKGKTREGNVGAYIGKTIQLILTGDRFAGIGAPESAAVYNQMMAHQTIKYTESEGHPGMHHIIPFHAVQMATFEKQYAEVEPKTDAFCNEEGLKISVGKPAEIVMTEVDDECFLAAQSLHLTVTYNGTEIEGDPSQVSFVVEGFDPETLLMPCGDYSLGDTINIVIHVEYEGETASTSVNATIIESPF